MRWIDLIRAGLVLACVCAAPPARAEDPRWKFTTGMDYSSGKYGGTDRTDIWYVPFTLRYNVEPWQFKLTVPYLSMQSAGGTIIGYDTNGVPIRSGGGAPSRESGLGDIVASATFSLVERLELLLDMSAKVKFGTASTRKGLGTGEQDATLGFDAYFPRGRATPFISLAYRMPGDPPGQNLRNTRQAGLGLAYKLSDHWNGGGMWDWRSAATSAGQDQRDLTLYAVYKSGSHWKLQGYLSKGFSDASADYGVGLMATMDY